MSRIGGGCLLTAGIVFILMGLCGIIAEDYIAGFVLMAVGAVGCVLYARGGRARRGTSPAEFRRRITKLAATTDGELTIAEASGKLGIGVSDAAKSLKWLVRRGVVTVDLRDGIEHFIFPGTVEPRRLKVCPYCGNRYSAANSADTCRGCGGTLEIRDEQ